MKKFIYSSLAITVCINLYHSIGYAVEPFSQARSSARCLVNVPHYDTTLVEGDVNNLPIKIATESLKASLPNRVTYQGNVRVSQGNRRLHADQLTVETNPDDTHVITTTGDVSYLDNFLKLEGRQAKMAVEKNEVDIHQGKYHLVNRLGRGTAEHLSLRDNRYVILKRGNFTTCPISNNSWSIAGTTIVHDDEKKLLKVWNAVFKIGPFPVLYSPYLQYPTGDTRRSGMLIPFFNYNSIDKLNIAVPFYWNIAPNMDATITPRFIERRGLQMQTETRYLNRLGLGTLAFDWLDHDNLYDNNRIPSEREHQRQRWLFHWDHDGLINSNWRIKTDMTRVSDSEYPINLKSNYTHLTDGYLTQNYQVSYANNNWSIALSSVNFQVFRSAIQQDVYQTQPQLDINYYYDTTAPLRFTTYAQVVNFISSGKQNPQTIRMHIAPALSYLLSTSWATLNSQATLLATHYHQDLPASNPQLELAENVNRVMPQLSLDGRLVFQRHFNLVDSLFTQTLEPRIKYQYIPYRDQSLIKNYDSALMQLDYIGLFGDQIYSGLDRITSQNQLSAGVTSRFYDNDMNERINFSFGQIYYFKQSRTGDRRLFTDKEQHKGSISWSADSLWRINQNAVIRGTFQYDTRLNQISSASGILEYRPANNKLLQLSYRYASENYINSIESVAMSPYKQAIAQVGSVATLPLNDSIAVIGSYYYDTKLRQSADSFIGLQYNNCCWGMNLLYGRRIIDWNNSSSRSEYDNKLSINFELRGFGNNRNNIAKMLDFGSLPYQTVLE